ncbi:MAG: fluoride efflux transporter FluC [Rhodoglobus sp.]
MIAAAVIVSGALAAVVRWLISSALASRRGFPWAVLIVNVVGSAVGGAVLGLAAAGGVEPGIRLVLLTGLCGGLTTFSTLSVETVQYAMSGRWRTAFVSVAANLVLGIGAAALAYAVAIR